MAIEPKDVVYLIATGARMTVESVSENHAVCVWDEYSRRPVPDGLERKVIGQRRDTFPLTALHADSRKLACDRCDKWLRADPGCDMYSCENGHHRTGMEIAAMALEGVHITRIEVTSDDPDRIASGLAKAFRDRVRVL